MITQAILDADQSAIAAAQIALAGAQAAAVTAQAALDDAKSKLAADIAQAQAEAHPILDVLADIEARVVAQAEVLGADFETAFAALVAKARSFFNTVTLPEVTTPAAPVDTTASQVDPSSAIPSTTSATDAGSTSGDASAASVPATDANSTAPVAA